jgi:hypothetical protein
MRLRRAEPLVKLLEFDLTISVCSMRRRTGKEKRGREKEGKGRERERERESKRQIILSSICFKAASISACNILR